MDVVKKYVEVAADFSPDGVMIPLWITWDNGHRYRIDKVTDYRRAASLKAGGAGIRYTCQIGGGQHFLFYEENYKWFVEAKVQKDSAFPGIDPDDTDSGREV
ncbi:MAG TPA: hypothetical protein DEP00_04895 [Lachnospiraceae bacterium]|jgi:hypothetical protein|nr:hypothetical protein [Lachnospiraceae bacterium]